MLCWNVYIGDFNSGEIKKYNIFNHWRFYEDCVKAKKKFKDNKDGFAAEVKSSLMYYYWSKCEWEIILDHWPDGENYALRTSMKLGTLSKALRDADVDFPTPEQCSRNPDSDIMIRVYGPNNRFKRMKIDVFDQVANNWDAFIDYLWEHRKELKARK